MTHGSDSDPTTDPPSAAPDEQSETACDQAALAGADRVANWDAIDGGWPDLMRGPGARLAAAGYRFAAAALSETEHEHETLTEADLVTTSDGQFTSERFTTLQATLVDAELRPGTDIREKLVLALDVAFETGARRAISDLRATQPS